MRLKGVCYDTGIATVRGGSTRPELAAGVVEDEIRDIATGVHANAIRISGDDPDRIAHAAAVAARQGLQVWVSPMLPNADAEATREAIAECARVSERLRASGARTTLVIGCELSVFMAGIMPGATHGDRLALLSDPARLMSEVIGAGLDPSAVFADFLASAAAAARAVFRGPLTYAAGVWEEVDWSLFDVVGIDAYRDAGNRATYPEMLRALVAGGKPVVATEFGCSTWRGAAGLGGMGWTVVDGAAGRLRDGVIRDEPGQAAELIVLLDQMDQAGLEGAFVYTYVAPSYPSDPDPARDLDTASFALVRSWPHGRTEPKAAYRTVADRYLQP